MFTHIFITKLATSSLISHLYTLMFYLGRKCKWPVELELRSKYEVNIAFEIGKNKSGTHGKVFLGSLRIKPLGTVEFKGVSEMSAHQKQHNWSRYEPSISCHINLEYAHHNCALNEPLNSHHSKGQHGWWFYLFILIFARQI